MDKNTSYCGDCETHVLKSNVAIFGSGGCDDVCYDCSNLCMACNNRSRKTNFETYGGCYRTMCKWCLTKVCNICKQDICKECKLTISQPQIYYFSM